MLERPVILLAFANQQDAYLASLKKESDLINEILGVHHDKGAIEIYREESAGVDNIVKAINRFKDRIVVFHYAGHADGERLYFEDSAGQAAGIAELLGQLPNLRLVFLNGCSTLPQVEKLLACGVKAVIATAVPINDEKAVIFAENFYRAFSNKNDIDAAFNFAVAVMRTKFGGNFNATIVQKGERSHFSDASKMPWGLYLNENPAEVLDWSLPVNFTTKVTRPPEVNYKINAFMVDIVDAMIEYDKELERLAYNQDDELIDERQALSLVIEHFPWPIGVQVRLLVTKESDVDSPSVERIRQLVSTYIVTSQFLYYIALSQLWDEKRQRTIELRSYFLDLLSNNQNNFNYFDFMKHLTEIVKVLQTHDCNLFVEEFGGFVKEFDEKGELFDAYLYLESLRYKVNIGATDSLEADKYQLCADGEYFLSTILIKIAFLVNYDLLTIRDIHVINYRNMETRFEHFIGRLNARVTDLAVTRAPRARSFGRFVNNASVVLARDVNNPDAFLNLTPFIIDRNAFGQGMTEDKAVEQQLFMYAFREGEEYKYLATLHNIYRVQERPADQLTTDEDTEDAANVGRTKRVKRGRGLQAEEKQSPFEVLKQQFIIFEQDLSK